MANATGDSSQPLYRRVLGRDFETLPPEVRALHDLRAAARATGFCDIERGRHWLSRLVGRVFAMPPAGTGVPVTVTFVPDGTAEAWRRDFGGAVLRSRQEYCPDAPGHLVERFGVLACRLQVAASDTGLDLLLRGVRFLGVPVPRPLWPRIAAGERVRAGLFHFDVAIKLPLAGLLIRYRGGLRPEPPARGARV